MGADMDLVDVSKSQDAVQQVLHTLAVRLVKAYLSNNSIPPAGVPPLLTGTHAALVALMQPPAAASTPAQLPTPAEIRKSIRNDGLVSFIDGKAYKTLKRHLTAHGLEPRAYRERFGLPADYPMVAPSYAAQRSALAKAIGLGRPGAMAEAEASGRRRAA